MREEDEEPLDPAVENVRRRLARMQMISSGIMVFGLMAVFLAIVYKVWFDNPVTVAAPATNVTLPAGASIVSSAMDGGRVLLTVRMADGTTQALLYNADGSIRTMFAPAAN